MRLNECQRIRSESSRIPSGIIWRDRRRLMFFAIAIACLSLRTIVLNQHLQTKFKTSVRSQDPTNIPPKSISTRRTSAPNPFPSSDNPTRNATRSIPSKDPTGNPTYRPNDNPTDSPTGSPTNDPSKNPTYPPTPNPALRPTVLPTNMPTKENNTSNNHHTNREIARIDNADPKILLLITTHLTDEHVRYFDCCWPRLMKQSKLLNLVHVLLFTNNPLETYNTNVASRIRALFANNPSVTYQHAPQQSLNKIGRESNKLKFPRDRERVRKQLQATLPMRLGFEQHWFHGYDWVIRINPDVLIRNSTWLMDAMAESSSPKNGSTNEKHYKLDAILHPCKDANHTHTDFLAFRPAALPNNNNTIIPFSVLYEQNHEFTAAQVFRSVLESKRFSQVMGAEPSGKHCRIQGQHSSVYHEHDSCQQVPWVNHANHDVGYGDLFCNALYGWEIS